MTWHQYHGVEGFVRWAFHVPVLFVLRHTGPFAMEFRERPTKKHRLRGIEVATRHERDPDSLAWWMLDWLVYFAWRPRHVMTSVCLGLRRRRNSALQHRAKRSAKGQRT